MGRKPSNGGPSFRFNTTEIAEMESILQAHNIQVPGREVLAALADKFSNTPERLGKVDVQIKQVWNWFQNRRYAVRAKSGHLRNVLHSTRPIATTSVQGEANNAPENSLMEFEARSARDGAWYDVACFLSHGSLETGDPEVLVRFAGFGHEEDEWVNVRKHIRQRSLPCESSECVAVLPGDLILCFQEGKEQALYFDAHVLDSQRRRHDARGCRCRFLVRYDHDQSEEIVPLRKICRRPETYYRLHQLRTEASKVFQQRAGTDTHSSNPGKGHAPAQTTKEQIKVDARAGSTVSQAVGHSPSGNTSKVNPNSETPQPQPQHTTKTHVGTVVAQMRGPAIDDHAAAPTPTQTSLPVLNYPKVSLEMPQSRAVATQLFSAAVTQVPATPTQAEPSEPEGLLKLTGSAETNSSTVLKQIIPGTEGHVFGIDSSTPGQISLHELGESKELLETTQPQYLAEQIMPITEGHKVDLCAATPLSSLLEPGKSKQSFETSQSQYSAEAHADTVVATLIVPTKEGPGAAVATSIPTQTSLSKARKSEVSLDTTQPQLSADTQMLSATDGRGAASVTATPTQVTLPKAGESEVPLETSPRKHLTEPRADTLAAQGLPATELQEHVVGARTLTQISLPESNESEVLLETSQAPPHSEETPEDSVLVQILSSTPAATPTQTSYAQVAKSNMSPGES